MSSSNERGRKSECTLTHDVPQTRVAFYEGQAAKRPSLGELNRYVLACLKDEGTLSMAGHYELARAAAAMADDIALTLASSPPASVVEHRCKTGFVELYGERLADRGDFGLARMFKAVARVEAARSEVGGESTTSH